MAPETPWGLMGRNSRFILGLIGHVSSPQRVSPVSSVLSTAFTSGTDKKAHYFLAGAFLKRDAISPTTSAIRARTKITGTKEPGSGGATCTWRLADPPVLFA